MFQGLSSVAYNSYGPCCSETFSQDRSNQLKGIIRDYFRNDYPKDIKLEIDVCLCCFILHSTAIFILFSLLFF